MATDLESKAVNGRTEHLDGDGGVSEPIWQNLVYLPTETPSVPHLDIRILSQMNSILYSSFNQCSLPQSSRPSGWNASVASFGSPSHPSRSRSSGRPRNATNSDTRLTYSHPHDKTSKLHQHTKINKKNSGPIIFRQIASGWWIYWLGVDSRGPVVNFAGPTRQERNYG